MLLRMTSGSFVADAPQEDSGVLPCQDARRIAPSAMRPDPNATLRERVFATVLEGPGQSDPAIRAAAATGADSTNLPADLRLLVDKIQRHAYKVTDDDVA